VYEEDSCSLAVFSAYDERVFYYLEDYFVAFLFFCVQFVHEFDKHGYRGVRLEFFLVALGVVDERCYV
jgi:hypothetical protein